MKRKTEKPADKIFGVVGEVVDHMIDIYKHHNHLCLVLCPKQEVYDWYAARNYCAKTEVVYGQDLKHVQQLTCGKEYSNIFFIGNVDRDIEAFVLSRHRKPNYEGPKTVTWFEDYELEGFLCSKE